MKFLTLSLMLTFNSHAFFGTYLDCKASTSEGFIEVYLKRLPDGRIFATMPMPRFLRRPNFMAPFQLKPIEVDVDEAGSIDTVVGPFPMLKYQGLTENFAVTPYQFVEGDLEVNEAKIGLLFEDQNEEVSAGLRCNASSEYQSERIYHSLVFDPLLKDKSTDTKNLKAFLEL